MAIISLLAITAVSYAAAIKCQHCGKTVDDKNSSCPYCLSDLNSKPASIGNNANKTEPAQNFAKRNQISITDPTEEAADSGFPKSKNERLISEQQAQSYFENLLTKTRLRPLIKITGFKRELKNMNQFKVIGEVTSNEGKPLKALSYVIEACTNSAAMSNVNLSKAAKIDINNPKLMSFNILFKLDPKYVSNIPITPVEFDFIVPKAGIETENGICSVKIFKKNADSEDTLYEAQHKPGVKVTLNILPEPGCNIVVNINDKKIYEKNY